jgi:hypothetical protein
MSVVFYGWYDFVAIGIWGSAERPRLLNGVFGMLVFWLGFCLACLVAFGIPTLVVVGKIDAEAAKNENGTS